MKKLSSVLSGSSGPIKLFFAQGVALVALSLFMIVGCQRQQAEPGEDTGLSSKGIQSVGELHNDVCTYLMGYQQFLNGYASPSDRLDQIEILISNEYGVNESLDSWVGSDGKVIDFNVQNSTYFNAAEIGLVQQILADVPQHNWLDANAIANWNTKMAAYLTTINTSQFQHQEELRNSVSVAQYSAAMWYGQVTSTPNPPIQASWACFVGAVMEDLDFYGSVCTEDFGTCGVLAGVYSYWQYNQCENP